MPGANLEPVELLLNIDLTFAYGEDLVDRLMNLYGFNKPSETFIGSNFIVDDQIIIPMIFLYDHDGSNSRFLLKAHGYQAYEQDKKICNRTIERLFLIPDSRFKRLQSWPNPFKKIVHT